LSVLKLHGCLAFKLKISFFIWGWG